MPIKMEHLASVLECCGYSAGLILYFRTENILDKIAVYTGSRNIYEDMLVASKSLIAHSDVDKVYFLIEDDIFPYDIPSIIKTKNVSDQEYFNPWSPNSTTKFTYFAMMRAALAHEFPEYDRLLSLDCDTIVVRDVSQIWNLPINDYYFAASKEPGRSEFGLTYTNVGVALMNLNKLRDGKADECIDVLNRQQFKFVDQDVMNYLCAGYVYDMHSEYNANEYTTPVQNPRIIHFAGMKRDRWHRHPTVKKYNVMSWDEVFAMRKQNKEYPD